MKIELRLIRVQKKLMLNLVICKYIFMLFVFIQKEKRKKNCQMRQLCEQLQTRPHNSFKIFYYGIYILDLYFRFIYNLIIIFYKIIHLPHNFLTIFKILIH